MDSCGIQVADSSRLSVEAGQVQPVDAVYEAQKEARMERSLQEMMMTKKRKRLYQKLMKKRKMKQKQVSFYQSETSLFWDGGVGGLQFAVGKSEMQTLIMLCSC